MRGVTFDKKHSYWTWGLMLQSAPEISSPKPKTKYVNVLGMDGALDISEALTGAMRYEQRKINMEFVIVADRENWSAIYSDILAALHGKKVQITLDSDPMHQYTGRVTVDTPKVRNGWITLKMTALVDPYKTSDEGAAML